MDVPLPVIPLGHPIRDRLILELGRGYRFVAIDPIARVYDPAPLLVLALLHSLS
jgi:hypothetical protein